MNKTDTVKVLNSMFNKNTVADISADSGMSEQDVYNFLVGMREKIDGMIEPAPVSVNTASFKAELLTELNKRDIKISDEQMDNFLQSVSKENLAVQRAADLIAIRHKRSNTYVYQPPNL